MTLAKCVLTILDFNWNQRFRDTTKLNICHHMVTSSTQLQNKSFHVVERTRTSPKCTQVKKARAKRAKLNLEISRCHLADYVKELYLRACRTCSTIIFPYSTNQIIVFWRRRCRCRFLYLIGSFSNDDGNGKENVT